MAFNPFRKSRPEDRVLALDSLDTSPAPTPPPPVSFKTAAPPPIPPRSTSPLPPAISTSESRERRRKSNVVKKVRVLSPPQSPDDEQDGAQQGMGAAWPFNVPMGQRQEPAQAQIMQQQQQHLEVPSAFPSVEDFERDGGHAVEENYKPNGPTISETQHTAAAAAPSVPPPNPFSKTLHDLENAKQKEEELHHQEELEGAALKAGNLAKGSLDVDAFRRLLLTGKPQDGTASPLPSKSQIVSDLAGSEAGEAAMSSASSVTEDTSETSSPAAGSPFIKAQDHASERRSGLAVEVTPEDLAAQDERMAGDEADDKASESDSSVSVQIGSRGKKPPPPPPSSRHGRSILNKSAGAPEPSRSASDRDVNKPLPAAPSLSVAESDADSPFDREAAGKIPESDTSLDDGASIHANATGATPKKPVPAPPPRRGHARTDTKTANTALSPPRAAGHEDDAPPRSSIDSAEHGHAQTLKTTGSAPAPPPPRRLTSGSRSGSGQPPNSTGTPSPGLSPSADSASLHEPEQHHQVDHKPPPPSMAAPPPPPPARHGSTRRPASVHAPEGSGGVARRGTGATTGATEGTKQREKLAAPPVPPPPRQRGSSKGSVDGHAARAVAAQHVETEAAQSGSGGNILADLEALQREVDAMRGKLG